MAANVRPPGCALVRDCARKLQRQPCLPDSPWPDERDEACVRIGEPLAQCLHVPLAAEQDRGGTGSETPSVHRRPWAVRWARASEERVTGLRRQVESCGQRTHGLDVGAPAFSTPSALTAWTERPAIVASLLRESRSRSALKCAPNDRGEPAFIAPPSYGGARAPYSVSHDSVSHAVRTNLGRTAKPRSRSSLCKRPKNQQDRDNACRSHCRTLEVRWVTAPSRDRSHH
jgi:hypothetical protein